MHVYLYWNVSDMNHENRQRSSSHWLFIVTFVELRLHENSIEMYLQITITNKD